MNTAVELRSPRWFHYVVGCSILALPFVQYALYLAYGHWLAIVGPLVPVLIGHVLVTAFVPRFASSNDRSLPSLTPMLVAAACLAVAFALPATGTMMMIRGMTIDLLAFMGASAAVCWLRRGVAK